MEKNKSITKCPKCGSKQFNVIEWSSGDGEVVGGKLLVTGGKSGGIDAIYCADCGEQIDESEFDTIEFCD